MLICMHRDKTSYQTVVHGVAYTQELDLSQSNHRLGLLNGSFTELTFQPKTVWSQQQHTMYQAKLRNHYVIVRFRIHIPGYGAWDPGNERG